MGLAGSSAAGLACWVGRPLCPGRRHAWRGCLSDTLRGPVPGTIGSSLNCRDSGSPEGAAGICTASGNGITARCGGRNGSALVGYLLCVFYFVVRIRFEGLIQRLWIVRCHISGYHLLPLLSMAAFLTHYNVLEVLLCEGSAMPSTRRMLVELNHNDRPSCPFVISCPDMDPSAVP